MGCDGIFDKLSNHDIIDLIWSEARDRVRSNSDVNIH